MNALRFSFTRWRDDVKARVYKRKRAVFYALALRTRFLRFSWRERTRLKTRAVASYIRFTLMSKAVAVKAVKNGGCEKRLQGFFLLQWKRNVMD